MWTCRPGRRERIFAPITASTSVTTARPHSNNASTVWLCSSAAAVKLEMKIAAMTA
jgi:hypothetical protein